VEGAEEVIAVPAARMYGAKDALEEGLPLRRRACKGPALLDRSQVFKLSAHTARASKRRCFEVN